MAAQIVPLPAELKLVPRSQWDHHRSHARYQCSPATLARIAPAASMDTLHGWVLNLSLDGAGVLLPRPLEPETLFVLHVKNSVGDRVYALAGRVVHATTQLTGDWLIGCIFADPLTADDLEALL
jgi:hypothetical protein